MSDENKVVSLRPGQHAVLIPGRVEPEVVETLEGYLEKARSGEVIGIVVAALHADDTVSGSRQGLTTYALLGMVGQLQFGAHLARDRADNDED